LKLSRKLSIPFQRTLRSLERPHDHVQLCLTNTIVFRELARLLALHNLRKLDDLEEVTGCQIFVPQNVKTCGSEADCHPPQTVNTYCGYITTRLTMIPLLGTFEMTVYWV